MAWPLPLYELALLTAGRAYEMNVPLRVTLVTPEDTPLAIFGVNASARVAELLEQAGIETITSAYAEIPEAGQIALHPQQREVHADRIVALPELYGPAVRGLPLSPEGFIRVDRFARVPDCGPVFAAGDATDFAVKHGGIAAQQADLVAESLAKLAGADVEPEPFHPVLRGMLLTVEKPYYMCARITGGHGFDSEFSPSRCGARRTRSQPDTWLRTSPRTTATRASPKHRPQSLSRPGREVRENPQPIGGLARISLAGDARSLKAHIVTTDKETDNVQERTRGGRRPPQRS